jgi:hypothetical protein
MKPASLVHFEEDTRYAIEHCAKLRSYRDLTRSNQESTIAVLV